MYTFKHIAIVISSYDQLYICTYIIDYSKYV